MTASGPVAPDSAFATVAGRGMRRIAGIARQAHPSQRRSHEPQEPKGLGTNLDGIARRACELAAGVRQACW
jgi:hypothetical protein